MSEERLRILKMLEEGKIETKEAEKLLKALGEEELSVKPQVIKKGNKKSLRIMVSEDDKEKVNIALPLGLAKGLLKFIPASVKDSLAEEDINLQELIDSVDNLAEVDELVRIEDGGDKVIIKIE